MRRKGIINKIIKDEGALYRGSLNTNEVAAFICRNRKLYQQAFLDTVLVGL